MRLRNGRDASRGLQNHHNFSEKHIQFSRGEPQAPRNRKRNKPGLFSPAARTTTAKDVVNGERASPEENQGEGERRKREGKLVASIAGKPVVQVHFPDRNRQIDADGECRSPGEESDQNEQAANKFGQGGQVGSPAGQSQAGYKLHVVMEPSEDLVIAVSDHDGAQREAHGEESDWLQTIEVAQRVPSGERRPRLSQEKRILKYLFRESLTTRKHTQLLCFTTSRRPTHTS